MEQVNNAHSRATMRRSLEDRMISVVIFIVMTLVFVAIIYPFYYCLIISLNQGRDASLGGIYFFPRKFTLDNYKEVFRDSQLIASYGMTILRTVVGTVSAVLFTGLVAYAMSHRDLAYRKIYMTLMIVAMYFSGGLIPYYMVLRSLGLLNTFGVYVIPSLFGIWNCILMINFFRTIPESLKESAKLDGANEMTIFFRVIAPLSMPIFATIALYVGVGHWNDWYSTSFFAQQNRGLRTLAYMLKELITRANLTSIAGQFAMDMSSAQRQGSAASATYTAESLRMATMIVVVVPIICVYPFLQRFFVKGVMVGSVKE
ncbi:MAG: carbohydrate ABC transporter permease [Clostridiales bacterium]|jgi:putative aldouronate transport system permease protein|nr:carbohydrate ABC transporter permease [Clostridiales bacterium]